ncbi:hypothetical protein DPMN_048744 [Dreissena polymorpha]|uniref:Secreted protein n=1 Tax=Dreissena polymorpha TaxID=45954 RepID=A0A9D4I2L8_DREPO|nr:hypothetical protein DPMN_048744 [Dreissena polymorpha]
MFRSRPQSVKLLCVACTILTDCLPCIAQRRTCIVFRAERSYLWGTLQIHCYRCTIPEVTHVTQDTRSNTSNLKTPQTKLTQVIPSLPTSIQDTLSGPQSTKEIPKYRKSTQVNPSRPKSTRVKPSRPKSTQVDLNHT